ncbi:MAG: hypothetical protein KJ558_13490 [Gammaproteobacteria bacterium]|nr:hypothetical protein [Gammaproteobacteria bacterium]MBU1655808.1 hypothetical protein [Gammaproteobacteria bacterium]MBU1960199.1 hypothetical protein [Gammaproteobacteria bacterium]
MKDWLHDLWNVLTLSLPVLLMVFGGGTVSDSVYSVLTGEKALGTMAMAILVGLASYFIAAGWIYWIRKSYLPVRTLGRIHHILPRKGLVAFVSPRNFDLNGLHISSRGLSSTLAGNLAQDVLATQVDGKPLVWNWQQLLRAVQPHATTLQEIHLIGSADDNGSHGQLGECAEFLRVYLEDGCRILPCSTSVDFEDIDALADVLHRILKKIKAGRSDYKEIMIDATGGMKTTSIAAAMVTLNNPSLHFQYVPTFGRTGQPIAFNVVAESQPEIEV